VARDEWQRRAKSARDFEWMATSLRGNACHNVEAVVLLGSRLRAGWAQAGLCLAQMLAEKWILAGTSIDARVRCADNRGSRIF
jgi:hypothetical protein